MIHIALVEDEETCQKEIIGFLKAYSEEHQIPFKIDTFSSAISFLDGYNHEYSFVFMDIQLPNLNGMDAIKKLREIDSDVLVIFVTSLAQYAITGYEVNAFDFILKPVNCYSFSVKLTRILEKIGNEKEKQIWVSTRNEKKLILVSKLKYVEVNKHKVIYHTTEGNITTLGSLKSVIENLKGLPFELCNQCYLVHLHYVTGINNYECILGDEKLQISLPKKKSFLHALNNYLGGGFEK